MSFTTPKTIVVTGCAGFIASSFIEAFRTKYPEALIVGIDNFATGRKDRVHTGITFYEASICDESRMEEIFARHKPEYVFHFAALPRVAYSVEHPAQTTFVNSYGTALLLEKARDHGTKRFIYSSSSSVYGPTEQLPTSEAGSAPNPVSPYALQKYSGEPLLRMASDLYSIDAVSLRYFNVFGPWQYGDSAYSNVISAWLTGMYFPATKKAFIEGDGLQSKDYCYIDNVVLGNMLAMEHPEPLKGEVFNIANQEKTSLLDIKKLLEEYSGKVLELEQRPPRPGDVRFSLGDVSKAKRVLGYEVKVDFKEGVKKTITWFESRIASGEGK